MSHMRSPYSNITVVQSVTPTLRGDFCLTQVNKNLSSFTDCAMTHF
jgi:hypothetical protein